MALASIAQVLLGLTGIIGLLLPYIGPLVIAPSVALIGLSLFKIAADIASAHWGIAFLYVHRERFPSESDSFCRVKVLSQYSYI